MRDQDIRDILYNAEEPVSPGVWSAVAAGLDAKKRIVPAWMWGAMAFAAAAAVAVGVFLWRPNQGYRLEEFTPASPLAARLDNSLSGGIVTPQSASQAPVRKSAAPVALREEASLEAVPNAAINPAPLQKLSSRLAMPPKSSYVAKVDDNTLLNELAWEAKPLPGRDISLTAAGNFQASSKAPFLSRRSAAPAAAPQEGVFNPNPDSDKPGFPFSVGLGVKWNFAPRWAIGTGVNYLNISRSFAADFADNGYVLTLDGLRIYIAGDTEDIPQMADLKDIDIAFLPCNQPYTMTIEQCVHAAQMIRPKVLIPYHFGDTDLSGLPAQLPGMDVRLRSLR